MSMDQQLPGWLEKRAVAKNMSHFTQTRTGRRSIRVGTLLKKETAYLPTAQQGERNQDAEKSEDLEIEGGRGMEEKLGSASERKEKAIGAAASARPWIKAGIKGAVPASIAASLMIPASKEPWVARKNRIVAGIGAIGAGAGVADKALKDWAERNKRKAVAKQILKTSSVEYLVPAKQLLIRKVASLAGDLRMNGLGGVKRPPFPTEDSKRVARTQFTRAQKPGAFSGYAKPQNLLKPGPSLTSVASIPANG